MNNTGQDIPDIVINRLPLYIRTLNELKVLNQTTISSEHLGNLLQTTPAQIIKDFSHFGKFPKYLKIMSEKAIDHQKSSKIQIWGMSKNRQFLTSLNALVQNISLLCRSMVISRAEVDI